MTSEGFNIPQTQFKHKWHRTVSAEKSDTTTDYWFHNPRLLQLYANAISKDKLKISVSSLKKLNVINLKARESRLSVRFF